MNAHSIPPLDRSRRVALVVGVLLLAAAVRGLFALDVHRLALYQEPTGDAATYVQAAQALARDGLAAPLGKPYAMAPLYPFFLRFTGDLGWGPDGARTIQFLLGIAGVLLLGSVGRRWGGNAGAITAGLFAALYGPLVFFEGELLSISLAVFFLEAALFLWGRGRAALAAGFALGLAALAQPNLLLAGAAAAGASVLFPERLGWPGRRAALLLAAGLCLPPAATLTRNLAVSGEPVLISLNGGVNFYLGNNPEADGTFHIPDRSGLLNRPEGLFTSARAQAEKAAGAPLGAAAVDRYWWLRGADFWIGSPGRALSLLSRKVLLCLNNFEIPNHFDYGYIRSRAPVLRFLPTFGWLLPLGGVGLMLAWRRRRRAGAVLFAGALLSVALFFVTARYRLPLAVFLIPAAGVTVERALAWRRRGGRAARLGTLGGAAALYAVLAFVPLVRGGTTRAHMLNLEGAALAAKGDLDGATRAFREAVEADPDQPEALNNLGKMLAARGDVTSAVNDYRRALGLDPTQAETYFNLEELYRKAGRHRDAMEILSRLVAARGGDVADVAGELNYRRGVNAFALGDTAEALDRLQDAVRSEPDLAGAWLTLSVVDRKTGRLEEAVKAARKGTELAPDKQETALMLAAALEAGGAYMEAAGAYQRALRIGPPGPELEYRLGHVLFLAGRDAEAETYLLDATKDRPYSPALWDLGRLYERQRREDNARTAYQTLVKLKAPEAAEARARLAALGPVSGHAREN